jgi:hypothetical protein
MKRFLSTLAAALILLLLAPAQTGEPVVAQEVRPERTYPLSPEDRAALLAGLSLDGGQGQPGGLDAHLMDEYNPDVYDCLRYVYDIYDFSVGWEIYTAGGLFPDRIPERLTSNSAMDIMPRLRRNGDRVAFLTDRDGNVEIYSMNIQGGDVHRLTNDWHWDGYPAWSPDGRQLAFVKQSKEASAIYIMNEDGSGVRQLSPQGFLGWFFSPTWSPSGELVAFLQVISQTHGRIVIMTADGAEAWVHSSPLAYVDNLVWSPSGALLAFEYDGDGDGWLDLGTISLAGGGPQKVIGNANWDYWMGSWTPKEHLAYTVLVYDNSNYLADARVRTTSGLTNHTSGPAWSFFPDVQQVDRTSPVSWMDSLPRYTRGTKVTVRMNGYDPGPYGIFWYRLDKRSGPASAWEYLSTIRTNWITTFTYTGAIGETVSFRSQAEDMCENKELVGESKVDAFTSLYAWLLEGRLLDAHGHGLREAAVLTTPAAFEAALTDRSGRFKRYMTSNSVVLSAGRNGYGPLTEVKVAGPDDRQGWWVLPPGDDVVRNGSFELDSQEWQPWGSLPGAVEQAGSYTGGGSLLLGRAVVGDQVEHIPYEDPEDWGTPNIYQDSSGTLHLYWATTGIADINYRRSLPEGGWSEKEVLSVSGDRLYLDLIVDAEGTAHLCWFGRLANGMYTIRYAVRPGDGSWVEAPAPLVSSSIPFYSENLRPRLAADSQGRVHMVYTDNWGIWHSMRTGGGAWSYPHHIYGGTLYSDIVLDQEGALYVVYSNFENLVLAKRSAAGVWEAAQNLPYNVTNGESVQIAEDSQRRLHLGFYRYDPLGQTGYVTLAWRSPQGVWSPEYRTPFPCWWNLSIQADPAGEAHYFCSYSVDSYYWRFVPEGSWTRPIKFIIPAEVRLTALAGEAALLSWGESEHFSVLTISIPNSGEGGMSQVITIPQQAHKPTLSLLHRLEDAGAAGQFRVLINGSPVLLPTSEPDWKHSWVDVSAWTGQTITLTLEMTGENVWTMPHVRVDEVSLGSWKTPVLSEINAPLGLPSGFGGLRLTIFGENFMPGAGVSLGGVPLLDAVWLDEHTLQATIPPGMPLGRHELVVINPGGYDGALQEWMELGFSLYLPQMRR